MTVPTARVPTAPTKPQRRTAHQRRRINTGVSRSLPLAVVFDKAFDFYKRFGLTFLWVVGLLYLPTQVLMQTGATFCTRPLFLQVTAQETPDLWRSILLVLSSLTFGGPSLGIPGVFSVTVLVISSAPVITIVSQILQGQEPDVRSAWVFSRRNVIRLLVGTGIATLAFLGVFLASFVVSFLLLMAISLVVAATGFQLPNEVGVIIGLSIVLFPVLMACAAVAKWFCFLGPLIVMEGVPLFSIAARNSQLGGPYGFTRRWFAMVLLPIVTFGLQFLMLWSIDSALGAVPLSPMTRFAATTLISTCITLFAQPYWMIFLTLWYYDYRVQREGLDLFQLAQALPRQQQVVPAMPNTPVEYGIPPAVRSVQAPTIPPMPLSVPVLHETGDREPFHEQISSSQDVRSEGNVPEMPA